MISYKVEPFSGENGPTFSVLQIFLPIILAFPEKKGYNKLV